MERIAKNSKPVSKEEFLEKVKAARKKQWNFNIFMLAIRKKRQREENPYFKKSYATVEEAAQAKTDYVWNTVLKDVDWDKFEEMRRKQAK